MKERGTYLVPTLLAGEYAAGRRRDQYPAGDRGQGAGGGRRPLRHVQAAPSAPA